MDDKNKSTELIFDHEQVVFSLKTDTVEEFNRKLAEMGMPNSTLITFTTKDMRTTSSIKTKPVDGYPWLVEILNDTEAILSPIDSQEETT